MLGMYRGLQLACLAWIAWLPVSQPLILYPALLGVAITSVLLVRLERLPIPRLVIVGSGIYAVFAVVYSVASFVIGNPGALQQTLVWIGMPLIWGPWALSLRGSHLWNTMKVLLGVTVVTGAMVTWMGIMAALRGPTGADLAKDGIPKWFSDLQQVWFTVADNGQTEMAYLGLSSMVGLAPLFIALACLPGESKLLAPRWLISLAAVLSLVTGVVSGRRGLMLVVLITPAICLGVSALLFMFRQVPREGLKRYAIGTGIAASMVGTLVISPIGTNVRTTAAIVASVTGFSVGVADEGGGTKGKPKLEEADTIRVDQVSELIGEWKRSPWVGNGFGAVVASGYHRSESRPWTGFENQHLQVLMNIGLVGMGVLLGLNAIMILLFVVAFKAGGHRSLLMASGITLVMLALANGTNPYLQAPGHGWCAFLAMGVCAAVLHEDRSRDQSELRSVTSR